MKLKAVGIDLAKDVLQIHGVDRDGRVVVKRALRRAQVLAFFAELEPCLIGMEACGSSQYWARKLGELGHDAKLMAPQYVKPYVKTNKNDAADAEAICEAVTRPNMRFVPIKSAEQQGVLALHRGREGLTRAKRSLVNQIKGLLREHGIVMAAGVHHALDRVPDLIEDAQTPIPTTLRMLLQKMDEHLRFIVRQIEEIDVLILDWHRKSEASKRLTQIPGIGPITATAIVASVGDASDFDNGRQMAAWLGLVPRQHSSGGKSRLLGISKRGNRYIRTLLVLGAQAVLRVVEKRSDQRSEWLKKLRDRRHKNIAALALANKNARTICALLKTGRFYEPLRQSGQFDDRMLVAVPA